MKTAPSENLQGAAEETVEVDDIDEGQIVSDLNAPNKDTNTILNKLQFSR